MRIVGKPNERVIRLNIKPQNKSMETPGPGAYDISLPFIQPAYQAIKKSEDIMILKVNQHCDTANFKSSIDRFANERERSPGPAAYEMEKMKVKLEFAKRNSINRRYSQRYSDLVEFMYQNRSKIEPIPDYQVEYSPAQSQNLRGIKNSYHRRQKQKKVEATYNGCKSGRTSTQSIINIKSSARLVDKFEEQAKDHKRAQHKTIDFPQQSSRLKSTKRPLEKEEKLLIHRKTLYNRNMLGMIISQTEKVRKSVQKDESIKEGDIISSTMAIQNGYSERSD